MISDFEENADSAGDGKWQRDTQGSRSTTYVVQGKKLKACFMARVYDVGPDTQIAKILSFATKGWGSAKRKTCISMNGKNVH